MANQSKESQKMTPDGKYIFDEESKRLEEEKLHKHETNWKRWGPYLSERQWATVREDYSADGKIEHDYINSVGNCWDYFPHDHARSKAYRWGEDGILGITDRECRLCFAVALWNGKDPILKERLFGLTGSEGNHGEDCKELYYYLESTPTHSYMKGLYKYPQAEYPYEKLVSENRRRGRGEPEFEITDTGIFDDGKYWDVEVEYAKNAPDDILIKLNVSNRSSEDKEIHLLPTFWYRNTWSWGCRHEGCWIKPYIRLDKHKNGKLDSKHVSLGQVYMEVESIGEEANKHKSTGKGIQYGTSLTCAVDLNSCLLRPAEWIFTDNETNYERLYKHPNSTPYVKDSFHSYIIDGKKEAINPNHKGTKVAAYHHLKVPANSTVTIKLRLYTSHHVPKGDSFGPSFDAVFAKTHQEFKEFYQNRLAPTLTDQEKLVAIQAFAGLLWSKQFYHYIVEDWLHGDPEMPAPPESRKHGRNADWPHLFNKDIIIMPDKWEYPWFAAWDSAFHCASVALVDVEFAKQQLLLFLREWYMHPNGCIPAYEFNFSDVNPPVHAWATWRVYKESGATYEQRDRQFLARSFQKLMINFTWWANRKDISGKHIFSGGFLGLDNIGVFDRSRPLPGGHLEQADGTSWMATFAIYMLKIALELAKEDHSYEDIASKFFEHFVSIATAINTLGGHGLWDEESGFYYDQLKFPNAQNVPLKIRSLVGVVPFFAVGNLPSTLMKDLKGFKKRTEWFLENRKDLAKQIAFLELNETTAEHLYNLAIPKQHNAEKVLKYLFDENEFLSPYGIRSLSRYHLDHPFIFDMCGEQLRVDYVPGESNTALFGGNSNWRGPIWLCMNILLFEALERLNNFYGDNLKAEFPTGSGVQVNLAEAADRLKCRMVSLFLPDENGRRPCHGNNPLYVKDPHFKDLILFYEYFHGDNGAGLGASHQTGWTALIVNCLDEIGKQRMKKK